VLPLLVLFLKRWDSEMRGLGRCMTAADGGAGCGYSKESCWLGGGRPRSLELLAPTGLGGDPALFMRRQETLREAHVSPAGQRCLRQKDGGMGASSPAASASLARYMCTRGCGLSDAPLKAIMCRRGTRLWRVRCKS
jgi:hypothetical protein